jgi:hypothetical protein
MNAQTAIIAVLSAMGANPAPVGAHMVKVNAPPAPPDGGKERKQ